MRKILMSTGNILRILVFFMGLGYGFFAFSICLSIAKEAVGPVFAFLSLLIFPVLLAVSPIYALIAWGRWFPLIFVYGLAWMLGMLFWTANLLTGEE